MNLATDWPALIARLELRRINLTAVLQVSRMTVWYWKNGVRKPNGDHALSLIALDSGQS